MGKVTRRFMITNALWAAALPGAMRAKRAASSTPSAITSDETIPEPHFVIEPSDPSMGPHFSDLEAIPGSTIGEEVEIVNIGDVAVQLNTYLTNVSTAQYNGGTDYGAEGDVLVDPAQWVDFEPITLTLEPGESRLIPFTVSVPDDAQPRQYVAGLVAETSDSWEIQGSEQFRQIKRYGTLVSVLVSGDFARSFEYGEVVVEDHAIRVELRNTGDYWLRLSGEVEILTTEGDALVYSPITTGRILSRDVTYVEMGVPDQFPSGDYLLNLSLTDEFSDQAGTLTAVPITIEDPPDPRGLFLEDYAVEPNAEDIVFANVSLTVRNGGDEIPTANVLLLVAHEGEVVEEYPLATNQILLRGDNVLSSRYIPELEWESGTYTFAIQVFSVDPRGGQQIELLNEELDAEIIVP